MAIGNLLILQSALLVSLAGGFTILHYPVVYQHASQQPPGRHIVLRNEDYSRLPCPGEGFFVHPDNCTRFYRCVDYAGTGMLLSRYMFECPKNHVFVTAAQTCVPGVCTGIVQPVVLPPSTTTSTTEASTDLPSIFEETATDLPAPTELPAPTDTVAGSEVVSSVSVQVITEPPAPTVPVGVPSDNPCTERYVQHPQFCNVYTPCLEPSVRYVCPTGTVFDQPRQMCRISAFDDGLCTGKEMFRDPFLQRTENVGAHVLLPDSLVISRTRFDGIPEPKPVRINGQPVDSSDKFRTPVQNFEIEPVLRPLFSRPAQVYRQPENIPYRVPAATFLLQPSDVSVVPSPPASTRYRPLAQVRRPQNHLHFPQFNPVNLIGFQREII